MPDFTPIVSDAYQEILERSPDPGGLAHFNERMNLGLSEAELREILLRSGAAQACRDEAERLCEEAIAALDRSPIPPRSAG
jgi:hypothetical protein